MDEAYLEIYSLTDLLCLAPIETIVTLFTIRYCDSKINIRLIRTTKTPETRGYAIDVSEFTYQVLNPEEIPFYASSCELPNVIVDEVSCVAGLCASLRQIIKTTDPKHHSHSLLGFKDACLLACAEASIWTKFCEVDLISTLKTLTIGESLAKELPYSIARFECHMSQPVRLHNLYKYTMSKKHSLDGTITKDRNVIPEHMYAEGSSITLSDIIIFVCVHTLLNSLGGKILELLPLTSKWYERLKANEKIRDTLTCLLPGDDVDPEEEYILPVVENHSLYKSDPKRYKPRNRIFTRQEDIEFSLELISGASIPIRMEEEPFGSELELDWNEIPFEATPEGGSLPATRLQRKFQQLENLCKPVMKLAKKGDVIVDFCSGCGHLGILLAFLLPNCTVVLLENKEESLNRAKQRVAKLQLSNVQFYQCNLDYFKGNFDIGVSLHACGVVTDLVIQHCVSRGAVFVSCPCCYGSLHDFHRLTYPRSKEFQSVIKTKDFLVLCHASDQTHDANNQKTQQGYECMSIVDTDRKLQAEEMGYTVHFAKLRPASCTPKNHLLVGIPKNRLAGLGFRFGT